MKKIRVWLVLVLVAAVASWPALAAAQEPATQDQELWVTLRLLGTYTDWVEEGEIEGAILTPIPVLRYVVDDPATANTIEVKWYGRWRLFPKGEFFLAQEACWGRDFFLWIYAEVPSTLNLTYRFKCR